MLSVLPIVGAMLASLDGRPESEHQIEQDISDTFYILQGVRSDCREEVGYWEGELERLKMAAKAGQEQPLWPLGEHASAGPPSLRE